MLMYLAYPHKPTLHNTLNHVTFFSLSDFTLMTCTGKNPSAY